MTKVFFVSGAAGVGKSYFSKVLADEYELSIIDFDDTLDQLILQFQNDYKKLGIEEFLAKYSQARYEDLISRALLLLDKGKSIVITAPFTKQIGDQKLWEQLIAPIKKYDPAPILYWVVVPDRLRGERIIQRGQDRDLAKVSDIQTYLAASKPTPPVVAHQVIRADQGLIEQIKR